MKSRQGLLSTILLTTVGILRDYRQRRWAMFFIVLAALLCTFVGSVFLMEWLKERPLLFLAYWGMSGWLTVTAALLAIFDLLLVRRSAIEEKRKLRKTILGDGEGGIPSESQEVKRDAQDP